MAIHHRGQLPRSQIRDQAVRMMLLCLCVVCETDRGGRFTTIDEARKMCPHLLVQHVATYRNGEAEAGYWGEVDPRTHKVGVVRDL